MWQLFNSDMEVLVRGGFIYLPLLYDEEIEGEVEEFAGGAESGGGLLVREDEHYFIKSLSLDSFVENYPAAFPEEYEEQRRQLRQRVFPGALTYRPPLDSRLLTILFEILPHFWRRQRDRRREKSGRGAVLAYLAAKLSDQGSVGGHVENLRKQEKDLQQAVLRLESLGRRKPDLLPRRGRARDLTGWFQEEVQRQLVKQEVAFWQRELERVQDLRRLPEAELGVLLTVAARGAVEVDGFGCCPDERYPGDYLIYTRTGAYVLQDYFGRPYLFPDCRVAVATAGPYHPVVLETYKHPLLRRVKARQQICLTDYQAAQEFSAAAAIQALEEGLNALFYGYNSRKRNGYNSLDRYGHDLSVVDFEDLRLSQDDVRVVSGELEVKNRSI